jgi:hypothetical protein
MFLRDLASRAATPTIDRDDVGESNFEGDQVSLAYGWSQSIAKETSLAIGQ